MVEAVCRSDNTHMTEEPERGKAIGSERDRTPRGCHKRPSTNIDGANGPNRWLFRPTMTHFACHFNLHGGYSILSVVQAHLFWEGGPASGPWRRMIRIPIFTSSAAFGADNRPGAGFLDPALVLRNEGGEPKRTRCV